VNIKQKERGGNEMPDPRDALKKAVEAQKKMKEAAEKAHQALEEERKRAEKSPQGWHGDIMT